MNEQLIGLIWLASGITCALVGFFMGIHAGAENTASKFSLWMIANGHRSVLESYLASMKKK